MISQEGGPETVAPKDAVHVASADVPVGRRCSFPASVQAEDRTFGIGAGGSSNVNLVAGHRLPGAEVRSGHRLCDLVALQHGLDL